MIGKPDGGGKRQSERDRLLRERRLTYTVREAAILLDIGLNQAYEWARAQEWSLPRPPGQADHRAARGHRATALRRGGHVVRGADLEFRPRSSPTSGAA